MPLRHRRDLGQRGAVVAPLVSFEARPASGRVCFPSPGRRRRRCGPALADQGGRERGGRKSLAARVAELPGRAPPHAIEEEGRHGFLHFRAELGFGQQPAFERADPNEELRGEGGEAAFRWGELEASS
ncbi:hypothetical protein MRX96_044983 [Rhipicephalus microplus]